MSRFSLPVGFLLLFVVIFASSGLGVTQPSSRLGTPASSPAASPSPVFNVVSATPDTTPRGEHPLGGLGRTDSDSDRSAQPIRPSGRISTDGGPLRGNNIRRPTLATRSVYDPYRLLDADQRETLRGDTERLRRAGIPTLVYIRISEANDVQATEFADRLLEEWNVESAPGANDGVVILISMGVTTRRSGEVTVRTGPHALPEGGLDATRLASITDERIAPHVERGRIYTGVLTGLRGMIYTISYYPAPQAPPTAWQRRVADNLTWLAPALGALALIGTVGRWLRRPRFLGARLGRVVPAFMLTCCLLLAPLSVYARSRLGVAVVVLIVLLLALTTFVRRDAANEGRSWAGRRIRVGPWPWRGRTPGTLAATSSPAVAASARGAMAARRARTRRRVGEHHG